jgi:glycosyltransferase involved in cell wall biosynthesis
MTARKITVWWEIPCKSAIPVFEKLAMEANMDVTFISLYNLSQARKELGWKTELGGSMTSRILSDNAWKGQIDKQLEEKEQLHIVNGFRQNERIRYLAGKLLKNTCDFGLVMEAPANLSMGWKRLFTAIVGPVIRPLRAMRVSRRARFVLSASGNKQREFERLGFKSDKIFPFGYFPDFPFIERDTTPASMLKILCIGWMKPFKGQDYLLRSVAELRSKGIPVACTITGYGPTEQKLRALHKQLDLAEVVEFAGVVNDERLGELFGWSNVLVAPGYEEPWGIRINEALLSGLPVVVSDGIGASELVRASGAGEVFKSGSVSSLTNALERYYDRIAQDISVFDLAKSYRENIKPATAGHYVADVIKYTDVTKAGAVPDTGRPEVPWLVMGAASK